MKYFFSVKASEELAAVADFYESQQQGLGLEFILEIEEGLSAVMDAPQRRPTIALGFQKYRIHRFPFALIYRVRDQAVEVYAVFDLRRRPNSWRRK